MFHPAQRRRMKPRRIIEHPLGLFIAIGAWCEGSNEEKTVREYKNMTIKQGVEVYNAAKYTSRTGRE